MSKDATLPPGYKSNYRGIDIDYNSGLYKALNEGNVDALKAELVMLRNLWQDHHPEKDFDINKVEYSDNSLLSIILSSNAQNKEKTLEALTSEGMDMYKGIEETLRGDYGILDYTRDEIQIITDAINNRDVKTLLDNNLPRLDEYRDQRKREELINTIHNLRDGEYSQKYQITPDLGINCDYTSNLYKALQTKKSEDFAKALDALQQSVEKDGIKFDINNVQISEQNILKAVIGSKSPETPQMIKIFAEKNINMEPGIASYLKEGTSEWISGQGWKKEQPKYIPTTEESKLIANFIKAGDVKGLIHNQAFQKCDQKKIDELVTITRAIRDGKSSEYKIEENQNITCKKDSSIAKALQSGKSEDFAKALDELQQSVEKDGIKFDINNVKIEGQNILNTVMQGYSSDKPQMIKMLAEKGLNIESGIAAYLQQPPAHESPNKEDIKMISDAMMKGELATLRDNEVFKKCDRQVQHALDSVTRAMGIDTAFDQTVLTTVVEQAPEKYKKMSKVNSRFSGLCDMICNYITAENTIDPAEKKQNAEGLKDTDKINQALETTYSNTHLLLSATIGQLVKAALFQEYPHSVLNKEQQHSVLETKDGTTKINHDSLSAGLTNVKEGEYVKFCVFKKEKLLGIIPTFSNGHSMLIKKVEQDKFVFFDPNEGTTKELTAKQLTSKLNSKFEEWNKSSYGFNEVCFINNSSYMKEAMTPKKSIMTRIVDKMRNAFASKPKVVTTPIPSTQQTKSQQNTR